MRLFSIRSIELFVCAGLAIAPAAGQNIITTIAGTDPPLAPIPSGRATDAQLSGPHQVVTDRNGNVFFTDSGRILRLSSDGLLTAYAGSGLGIESGDGGPATLAGLAGKLVGDAAGNLYLSSDQTIASILSSDPGPNCRIREITTDGIIRTIARYRSAICSSFAVDGAGNFYEGISGLGSLSVMRVTPAGVSTRLYDSSPAVCSPLYYCSANMAVDDSGNLYMYFVGTGILKVSAAGSASTLASDGKLGCSAVAMAPSSQGDVYAGCSQRILRIAADGGISTVAGNGQSGSSGDGGLATAATFDLFGLAADRFGNLYLTDPNHTRVRKVDPGGIITTVAGSDPRPVSDEGLPATSSLLISVGALTVDRQNNLYFVDSSTNRIRKISTPPASLVTTVAGNGIAGFSGDGGAATSASFDSPGALATDLAGNLYIADTGNNRIRMVTRAGIVSTVAGNGQKGQTAIGSAATNTPFESPRSLAVDSAGNIYVGCSTMVKPNGVTATASGCLGIDPGGAPHTVNGNGPGVAVDFFGNVFQVALCTIQKVEPSNRSFPFAGAGGCGHTGDGGLALAATITPTAIALDGQLNLYISDGTRIREVLANPPALQTTTASLSFAARAGGAPANHQFFGVLGGVPNLPFTATASTADGHDWLTVNPTSGPTPLLMEVVADPGNLPVGQYKGVISIRSPNTIPTEQQVQVSFNVADALPPKQDVDKEHLFFNFPRTPLKRVQTVTISNGGSGTLQFSAVAKVDSGSGWLTVSPAQGTATPRTAGIVTVQVDSSKLTEGTFTGTVTISSATSGETHTIAVVATVSRADQAVQLSQSGLSFTAVVGGGIVPAQAFGVVNIGTGLMSWTVSTSASWLLAAPANGVSDAGAAKVPLVEVGVDPTGMKPGRYFGVVRVDAAAANTPQQVTVVLDLLQAGSNPGSIAQPNELVFAATAGGTAPAAQELFIYNPTSTTVSFRAVASFDAEPATYLAFVPHEGVVNPQQPVRVVVQPLAGSKAFYDLSVGAHRGSLTFQFLPDGSVRTVRLLLIVSPTGSGSQGNGTTTRHLDCTPTKLLPAVLAVGQSFITAVGYPAALTVEVKDECGAELNSGGVVASFSNTDAPLQLKSIGEGKWQETWINGHPSVNEVTITINAVDPDKNINGSAQAIAGLGTVQDPPVTSPEAVVSAVSSAKYVPLAPGGLISIFGNLLADGTASASATPLPTVLGQTSVVMAGTALPLLYAGPQQINALVPWNVETNTIHQLSVSRGATISQPVPVNVANAQPAVFVNQQAGGNQALAVVVRSDGTQVLNGAANPAHEGDALVLYSGGLGAVSPAVATGVSTPNQPLSRTRDSVLVRLGSMEVSPSFAGLTPAFVGLYQINVTVPGGAPKGDAVPLTVSVAGQVSPAVTVAIR